MMSSTRSSAWAWIAPLVVLIVVSTGGNARAGQVTFTWVGSVESVLGSVSGDPLVAPLTAPVAGGFGGATILQDGSRFTITGLTLTGVGYSRRHSLQLYPHSPE